MYWDVFLKIRERISDVKPWNRLFGALSFQVSQYMDTVQVGGGWEREASAV